LPVTEKGKLCGIISDRDIAVAYSLGAHIQDESKILVGDACTADPYTVEEDASLDAVAHQMAEAHIGSALVVRGDELVGIFTTTDACRVLGDFLKGLG
jgi:acetoin utilization protein AcuB